MLPTYCTVIYSRYLPCTLYKDSHDQIYRDAVIEVRARLVTMALFSNCVVNGYYTLG